MLALEWECLVARAATKVNQSRYCRASIELSGRLATDSSRDRGITECARLLFEVDLVSTNLDASTKQTNR